MRTPSINSVSKSTVRVAFATMVVLVVPFLAMQFTDEVVWDLADFAVAGALLFGAGLTYELAVRKAAGKTAYRVTVGLAVAVSLLLVWVNLAVGLIGKEDNPANLMYLGVIAVGIVGATIARFRPHGMALTLFTMAFAQAMVAMIALMFGLGSQWNESIEILFSNGFFVALFSGSACLFLRASHRRTEIGGS